MSWLVQLFRPRAELPASIAERIEAWRQLPAVSEEAPLVRTRFVVVDVETSGLNPRRDRLLSIGAVVVEQKRIAPQQTFSAVLRNETPTSRENILVHGLTPTMQAAGEEPVEALSRFLSFVGRSPCIAYHAGFDQTVLDRALRAGLGVQLRSPWLDLAQLAPRLAPEARLPYATLDDWLTYFKVQVHTRHDAMHDALATAELLLILLARAEASSMTSFAALRTAAESQKGFNTRGGIGGA